MRSLIRQAAKVAEDRKERNKILTTMKDVMSNLMWLLACLLLMLTIHSGPSLAASSVSQRALHLSRHSRDCVIRLLFGPSPSPRRPSLATALYHGNSWASQD